MSTHQLSWPIDPAELLVPISAENPVGNYLQYSTLYDEIKQARDEDVLGLSLGDGYSEGKRADWAKVESLCIEALSTRTKDLQIAAYLLEAWLHLHGTDGLETGLALLLQLGETYWETVFPPIEEDDPAMRLSPFNWINTKLAIKLGNLSITQPISTIVPPYRWMQYQGALRLEQSATRDATLLKSAAEKGNVTLARFNESVMLTPTPFFNDLNQRLETIIQSTSALEQFLAGHVGESLSRLTAFRTVLRQITDKVANILNNRLQEANQSQLEEVASPSPLSPNINFPRNRAGAYQHLAEIAEFLMQVEPHSPTPYLLKRAVSWGSMPLTQLLLELVEGEGDRQAIFSLLGIQQAKSN